MPARNILYCHHLEQSIFKWWYSENHFSRFGQNSTHPQWIPCRFFHLLRSMPSLLLNQAGLLGFIPPPQPTIYLSNRRRYQLSRPQGHRKPWSGSKQTTVCSSSSRKSQTLIAPWMIKSSQALRCVASIPRFLKEDCYRCRYHILYMSELLNPSINMCV
jgi:hypothetical protein